MTNQLLGQQTRFAEHMLGTADATGLLAGSPERRQLGLAIYANAYRRRLIEALADAFAKTRALLGVEAFEAAALAYISDHPPTTRNLRWFGDGFADHLRRTALANPMTQPLAAADAATAAPVSSAMHAAMHAARAGELADLDWALRQAFDGPDSPVLAAADLAALPAEAWANLTLKPVPTACLLYFKHNTVAVWQAINDETELPPAPIAAAADAATDADAGPAAVTWLIWRQALQPHFRSLHPIEAALLSALLAGASFGAACLQAQAQTSDDCTPHIGAALRQWLDEGVLCEVVLAADLAQGSTAQ